MKKLIQTVTGGYSSSAKVVDGTLILSLPDATSPVVWQMDLGQVRASALEVREKEGGSFVLTLKTPRGDVNDIAPFATRAQAVKALMVAAQALEQGRGQIRPGGIANDDSGASAASPGKKSGRGGKWLAALAGGILLLIIFNVLLGQAPKKTTFGAGGKTEAAGPDTAQGAVGVPLSADEFLRGR